MTIKPFFEKCECGSDIFKIKVVPFGDVGTDYIFICAKCGEYIGRVIGVPLDERDE